MAYSKKGKLDLLKRTCMLECKPSCTLVDIDVKFGKGKESPPIDKESFHRLIE